MELYYTTSVSEGATQTDPRLSLGGYKSASLVANDDLGNLFGEITPLLLSREPEKEYIGLVLVNETSETVDNLWIWFDFPVDSYSKLSVAAVDLALDSNGVYKMERIQSKTAKPVYATFYEADGVGSALSLGTVEPESMIGLWICRELVAELATTVNEDASLYETDPNNEDLVVAVVPAKSDSISINFIWGAYYGDSAIGASLV